MKSHQAFKTGKATNADLEVRTGHLVQEKARLKYLFFKKALQGNTSILETSGAGFRMSRKPRFMVLPCFMFCLYSGSNFLENSQ